MSSSSTSIGLHENLRRQLASKKPFSLLSDGSAKELFDLATLRSFPIGSRLIRPDELSSEVFLVLSGEVRLLVSLDSDVKTICKRGSGQLIGWSSLLRAESCEWVLATTDSTVITFPSQEFIKKILSDREFSNYYSSLPGLQESYHVAISSANLQAHRVTDWDEDLFERCNSSFAASIEPGHAFVEPIGNEFELEWFLSTAGVPGFPVGSLVKDGMLLPSIPGFTLNYRFIGLPKSKVFTTTLQAIPKSSNEALITETHGSNLEALGILEDDLLEDSDRFPSIRGRGQIAEASAVLEMVALHQRVPFRRDAVAKTLEAVFRRNKGLSIELMGSLSELLGLRSQLAETPVQYISSIETPSIAILDDVPIIFYAFKGDKAIIGHPHFGLQRIEIQEIIQQLGSVLKFVTPRRVGSTPTSKFGWSWFTPLLGKYKLALAIVFVSSLLAQLFGLAIPLLIQQIIDKVLAQGNLSSLNVLGSAMVVMALFQGLLKVLRSYIFVDTTDRMDLTLGSAVIDRLLSLPLAYFEKRPVGELSQRLGELNTIRNFVTGTALLSVLNIIFATLYLAVMLVYSPLLTAVALSTLPVYLLLVFVVSPIYKNLIRKRAVAQARTQSHLIEVLGGIQTVKAQHFELTARWKWQDRYRHFVDEGFKSTALGSASGEIGAFLNQLSGLLILWVGMWLVLQGEFTLGQLIAFRIIAGNVTGPLLQLSNLYQGFQKVQLSMERLSDILDQNPELGSAESMVQIAMPPIKGNVRFENVRFRFGEKGPYQVDDVSADISTGSFVGVVGQSGSGKSTLMKLLPKLYLPSEGRIFIDDYDITKVELSSLRKQIGIVPQDSLLFEGTIADNISLNDPQASTEAILDASRIACAHDFIMSLGQGYATQLSERGSNLSGGQRQRIAIARTILSNPQLLVMDEATSALDFDTERQLCRNLQEWAQNRTVFFITHRLSTIRGSDLILVMNQGCLVESGTHNHLLSLEGRYAALTRQQEASNS